MKIQELFEDSSLKDFVEITLLMKHGQLSRAMAEQLFTQMKETRLFVNKEWKPGNLKWKEDKKTGTLVFLSSQIPGSWKSGTAAMGRGMIKARLNLYGFNVAGNAADAIARIENLGNSAHIYFWGPGTPPSPEE